MTSSSRPTPAVATPGPVTVQIFHLAGCPHLERARAAVHEALAERAMAAAVEEIEGEYASPTVLVDGADVTGHLGELGTSCRLDLPTRALVLEALDRGPRGDSR
jgi:hypothetical protein